MALHWDQEMEQQTSGGRVFDTESALVQSFTLQLTCISEIAQDGAHPRFGSEFDYARGRTDIIAADINGNVIAFEAKLTRWRTALHQAYRNTCFSDRSYVVLPMKVARRAALFEHDFAVRGVGLYGVGPDELVVFLPAPKKSPTQPWLNGRALDYIELSCAKADA